MSKDVYALGTRSSDRTSVRADRLAPGETSAVEEPTLTLPVPLDRGATPDVTVIVDRIMRSAASRKRAPERERRSDVSAFQSAI